MATNLALDDNLIKEAQNIGSCKKKETVTKTVEDYIKRKNRKK